MFVDVGAVQLPGCSSEADVEALSAQCSTIRRITDLLPVDDGSAKGLAAMLVKQLASIGMPSWADIGDLDRSRESNLNLPSTLRTFDAVIWGPSGIAHSSPPRPPPALPPTPPSSSVALPDCIRLTGGG
eukprot:3902522-Pyramimonas_sp.AAC.1